MTRLTTDPNDPEIVKGTNDEPVNQGPAYLILSDEERAKGFVQPVRDRYVHKICCSTTTMPMSIAETYARDPYFYGGTYCVHCGKHRPLGEFRWPDGSEMSPALWSDEQETAVMKRVKELKGED